MYRLFRPTVISGHTRPYETHLWPQKTETYHAILPLLLYTVEQENR